jgi:tRNA pseudouridine38-40 synthase
MTVQEILQTLLKKTLGEEVKVIGAGRTDSGVHALGQVAHFKTEHSMEVSTLHKALNAQLPEDIAVSDLEEMPEDFHANQGARSKTYTYLLLNSRQKQPFLSPFTWRQYGDYNLSAVRQCLDWIRGTHDFRSFCAADSTAKTTERTLVKTHCAMFSLQQLGQSLADLAQIGAWLPQPAPASQEALLCAISFQGRGFLKHMVRNLLGTLRDVAFGKLSPQDFKNILELKDRTRAGVTAPARGLFLVKVDY